MPMGSRHNVYRGRQVVVDFEMDTVGIARMMIGPELKAAVRSIAADRAKPFAESISPHHSGLYAKSFKVNDTYTTINGMRRVCAELYNDARRPGKDYSYATLVEVGGDRPGPGARVLAKTIDHLNGQTTGVLAAVRGDLRRIARTSRRRGRNRGVARD